MARRIIEEDKNGNLVKWYGFWVDEDANNKACHIDFFAGNEPCCAELYLHGNTICKISYFKFWLKNFESKKVIHTENEIADFIYKECRKHVKFKRIYVDKFTAEILNLAGNLEDFIPYSDIDNYFLQDKQI